MNWNLWQQDYSEKSIIIRSLWVQTNGPFWWTILTCIKVMWYCLAMNYFWCCLNQMPKPLIRGSYILRIEKYEECWLTYSDDLLVKLNEKSDTLSYKPLFKNFFLQTNLQVFLCLCLCEAKANAQKNWAAHLFHLVWVDISFYSIKGSTFLVLFDYGDRESGTL